MYNSLAAKWFFPARIGFPMQENPQQQTDNSTIVLAEAKWVSRVSSTSPS